MPLPNSFTPPLPSRKARQPASLPRSACCYLASQEAKPDNPERERERLLTPSGQHCAFDTATGRGYVQGSVRVRGMTSE